MFYFVGVKGVIRSYRSAQELKSRYSDTSITFGFHSSNSSSSFHSKEVEHLRNLSPIIIIGTNLSTKSILGELLEIIVQENHATCRII